MKKVSEKFIKETYFLTWSSFPVLLICEAPRLPQCNLPLYKRELTISSSLMDFLRAIWVYPLYLWKRKSSQRRKTKRLFSLWHWEKFVMIYHLYLVVCRVASKQTISKTGIQSKQSLRFPNLYGSILDKFAAFWRCIVSDHIN